LVESSGRWFSGFLLLERFVREASDPSPRRNVCKVFIRFELGLDLGFTVIGKVLILLGFGVGDIGKVFISNKKAPEGSSLRGSWFVFSTVLSIEDLG
jgi:hypothetical protein